MAPPSIVLRRDTNPSFPPARSLSIADRFMSSSFEKSLPQNTCISNADIHAGVVIHRDFMAASSDTSYMERSRTNGSVHPLEAATLTETDHDTPRPPSATTTAAPRLFGSQDTLINQPSVMMRPEKHGQKYNREEADQPSSPSFSDNALESLPQSSQRKHRQSRRRYVFALFITAIGMVVLSALLWPRTPLIRLEGASLLAPAKVTETSGGFGNVQFETQWTVQFTVDNRQNWLLPTHLVQLHVLIKDTLTGNIVGKETSASPPWVLAPGTISSLIIDVALDYQARDTSDATYASLKKACTPTSEGTLHEVLGLSFWMTLSIWGQDVFGYSPTVSVAPATGGFVCPISF